MKGREDLREVHDTTFRVLYALWKGNTHKGVGFTFIMAVLTAGMYQGPQLSVM